MLSLHDHFVRQFFVDAETKRLRLTTAFPTQSGPEFAEAIFEGLAAYLFDGDALGTIIFDIKEVDPLEIYDRLGERMRTSFHAGGGHAPWVESRESARQFFDTSGTRGFRISASIGLEGAIWAQSFTSRRLEKL